MSQAYGALFASILVATMLAVPATWLTLRLYRRHVLALMARRAGPGSRRSLPSAGRGGAPTLSALAAEARASAMSVEEAPAAASMAAATSARGTAPTTAPPELRYVGTGGGPGGARSGDLYRRMRQLSSRAAAVYALGGLCFAGLVSAGITGRRILEALITLPADRWTAAVLWSALERNWAGQLWGLLLQLCLFVYPTWWVIHLVTARSRRTTRAVVGLYLTLYILLNVLEIHFVPQQERWVFVALWLACNLLPTLFMAGFRYRGLQGIGPLIYAALLTASVAAQWALTMLPGSLACCPGVVLLLLIGALAGALLAGILRQLYERKWLSESSLMTDSIWLVFGFYYAWGLGGDVFWTRNIVASLLLYKVVTAVGFALLAARERRQAGREAPQLLFLRVFALGKRAEQLYTSVANSWRYVSSIRLITGPDLATATVAPHNLLDYLTRRLGRLFIDGPEALERRIAALDLAPDPGGRYRVNEFFCHADTWQMALSRLAGEDVVVLSDLRRFSEQNAGCVYEIGELLNRVPLERVLFVVDDHTDEPFLRQTTQRAWLTLASDSPNRRATAPALRLFHYTGRGPGDSDHLLRALAETAG